MNAGFFFSLAEAVSSLPTSDLKLNGPHFWVTTARIRCAYSIVTTRTISFPYPHETARAARNVPHNSRSSTIQLSMKKNHQAFEGKAANSTNFVVRKVLIGGIRGMGNFRPISYFFSPEGSWLGKKGKGERQTGRGKVQELVNCSIPFTYSFPVVRWLGSDSAIFQKNMLEPKDPPPIQLL